MEAMLPALFDPVVFDTATHVGKIVEASCTPPSKRKSPVSALNISAGIAGVLKVVASNVLSFVKCVFLCIATQVLTVVGGTLSSISSIIDTVKIVSKIKALSGRVQVELDHAIDTDNFVKLREITLYTLSKWVDLTKNFFVLATSVVSIIALAAGVAIFSPAVITFVVINLVLFLSSYLISKLGRVDEIEKRHFSKQN